jgi:hypothetical protein
MTYPEIIEALRKLHLESTEDQLDRAVDDEARVLLDPKNRKTTRYLRGVRQTAEEFFAEDISRFLAEPETLTPNAILHHRRRYVVAWAIAENLRVGR